MIRKAAAEDREKLEAYLKKEAVYNTFILADIADFGFDSSFQTIWLEEEQQRIVGVYLRFYENLILYSESDQVNLGFLGELFRDFQPDVVMGKMENINQVSGLLPDYRKVCKDLYLLDQTKVVSIEDKPVKDTGQREIPHVLTEMEADKAYEFIQTIPEIRGLYTSRQMIRDRIAHKKGTHYVVFRGNEVAAHANSAASCEDTVMIGGVATAKSYRRQGLAGLLVGQLCRDILAQGKLPCLFCDNPDAQLFFTALGFDKKGLWGTLIKG